MSAGGGRRLASVWGWEGGEGGEGRRERRWSIRRSGIDNLLVLRGRALPRYGDGRGYRFLH